MKRLWFAAIASIVLVNEAHALGVGAAAAGDTEGDTQSYQILPA